MKNEITNPVLRADVAKIIENKFSFSRGTVSGFSIEIFEPETESYTSYIYYSDEKSRDNDWELLCSIK